MVKITFAIQSMYKLFLYNNNNSKTIIYSILLLNLFFDLYFFNKLIFNTF